MGLETATYINSLIATNPTGSDDRSTADDHLRLIKASLKRTFANIDGEVRATPANLNFLTAVAEDVQAKLDTLSVSAAATASRVASMSASMAAVESGLATVNSQAATNASRINTLSASMSAVEARVGALEVGSASNAARINTLSISVSIIEASVAALNSQVASLSATFTVRTNQLSASIASAESHIDAVSAAAATKVSQSGTMVVTTSDAELKFTGNAGNPYLRISDLVTGGLYGMSHNNSTGTTTIFYKGSAGATTRQLQLRQDGGIRMYPPPSISSSLDVVTKEYVDAASYAYLYKATSQSIPSGAWTAVEFDAEVYDTDGYHDNTVNNTRITIPAGVKRVRLSASVMFGYTTNGVMLAQINKNGTAKVGAEVTTAPAVNGVYSTSTTIHISTPVIEVNQGDYFELIVHQTSGGALNINGGIVGDHNTIFEVHAL